MGVSIGWDDRNTDIERMAREVSVMKSSSTNLTSEHFQLQALKPGVFAAISKIGGAGIGNAGLIDLGDRTLVFDTFLTPQAAADLKRMSVELTGRQPELVINSHYHNDHTWGNQVFKPEALLLSAEQTRQLMTTQGQEEETWYRENSQAKLEELQRVREKQDASEQETVSLWLGYYRGLVEAIPSLRICLPDMTFPDRFTIYGSTRRIELMTYQNGHSGCDTVLYLPDDQILFAADLLFVDSHPFLADGDADALIGIMEKLQALPATAVVPGHGPVGSSEDFARLIRYVKVCMALAKELSDSGTVGEAEIQQIEMPADYQDWTLSRFFQMNIWYLLRKDPT